MKDTEFVYVTGSDWVGLYVNGQLVEEGHSLCVRDIFYQIEKNGGRITRCATIEADDDWLMEEGSFPATLGEVKAISFPAGLILA